MSEPAFQIPADEWPHDDESLHVAPIGGRPWPDARFEQLWTEVDARNGETLRAVAAAEATAA